MMSPGRSGFELAQYSSADELARAAAAGWLTEIEAANRARRNHYVALSGGRITQKFFASVVEQATRRSVSFDRVHFFWADERCVPAADPESNFRLANELLFTPLKIGRPQIHRVEGEKTPEDAARSAEAELLRIVHDCEAERPVLDLIFLGLGEDGHVASLFPGEPGEAESTNRVYKAVLNSPKPPPERVTLTYGAIAAARAVWTLASGMGKEEALREAISPGGRVPLARVLGIRPSTKIFTDIRIPESLGPK